MKSQELVVDLREVEHRLSLRQGILEPAETILQFRVKESLRPTLQMAMEIEQQAVLSFNQPNAEQQRSLVSEAAELFLSENDIKSRVLRTSCTGTTLPYAPGVAQMRVAVPSEEAAANLATQIERYADRFCSAR